MVFALVICAAAQKGTGFGLLCHGFGLLSCFGNAGCGVAENKDIMSQDESLMDIDSVDSENLPAA
jgi:hypothetical protein